MSPLKALLVDAVCGNPVPRSLIIAMNGEDCELFKSTGNQWNESYAWKRESLEKMTPVSYTHLTLPTTERV